MSWNRPSLKSLYERISRDFSGRLLDGSTVKSRSVIAVLSKVWAGACHLMHGFLAWAFLQVFADTCEAEYLERWASIWNINRKGSSKAHGQVKFKGDDGAIVPKNTLLLHSPSGLQFKSLAEVKILNKEALAPIEAVNGGINGNLGAGLKLNLVSPIAGLLSDVLITNGLIGGADEEDDESLRQRLLDRLRKPPRGGAKHDYEFWAKEVPGVTRAWCFPLYAGIGTVGLCILSDNSDDGIFPNAELIKNVKDYIDTVRPASVKEFLVFAPEQFELNLKIAIKPNSEAVKISVRKELAVYLDRTATASGLNLYLSNLSQVISHASGEEAHKIINPPIDIEVPEGFFPVLGDIDFVEL